MKIFYKVIIEDCLVVDNSEWDSIKHQFEEAGETKESFAIQEIVEHHGQNISDDEVTIKRIEL